MKHYIYNPVKNVMLVIATFDCEGTVTLDSIPQTLARIEERIQKNELAGRKSDYDPNDSESVQARLSSEWVEKKLRPYLAELRALTKN